jgi:hypothetical protein
MVELRLPGMDQSAVRRLDAALHAADRRIGVSTGRTEDGGVRLIIYTDEIIRGLAGRETAEGVRYDCPCCDEPTLAEPPPGTFEICDVCGWEDDNVQFEDPDYTGGANRESLRQARAAFRASGPHARP